MILTMNSVYNCTLSGNLDEIVSILSTKYLEKCSQSDFTNVNSGRAGGGILCRMLLNSKGDGDCPNRLQ